ncbi:F-box protein At2g26850-like isoform X2 [Lotus japonicus]|uniref:F-box protein At2g26850-like isoform X2 n=1 Tax=Lotus japonicus TaxID=34305 RepID=UPI002583430A|nr:F-box protein At2g26850-like isoform X2 [Lotus japonicus]
MALFVCLESGRFWFPAQAYLKRMPLYFYDVIVSYNSETDTFRARSPNNEWRMIGRNIEWDRLRSSPAENFSRKFYMSNKNDLKPGDHIEIQRRKRRECPYDMLVVEFMQYQHWIGWRKTVLNRNVYEDQADSRLSWLGGIRKLDKEEEIERWKSLLN